MAKSKAEAPPTRKRAASKPRSVAVAAAAEETGGYLAWSRDPAVGLFAVLPLWIAYEALRQTLTPSERNGAEALVTNALFLMRPHGLVVLRIVFAVTVVLAAVSILRRRLPWGKVALVSALEGTVYGLMLGPLSAVLMQTVALDAFGPTRDRLAANLVGSLGAGIFEEAVFRLGLLSLLALAAARSCVAFGLPKALGVAFAILASGALFSLFHHLGAGGEPFDGGVFTFRLMAGVLLGVLFVFRGFAVVVYTHAFYDVHYYLTNP